MDERIKKANAVTLQAMVLNVFLTGFKIFAGVMGHSGAIVADAVHSFSDFSTDIALLWGVSAAAKPADDDHQYGHGRIETMVSAGIGLFLFIVGGGIFIHGLIQVVGVIQGEVLFKPGWLAVIAAMSSVVMKEWIYRKSIAVADETENQALAANAWHHRSDALSSFGVMIGIGGAIILGERWRILDPVAAMIVSFFIMHAAVSIVGKSLNELMEGALTLDQETEILSLVKDVPGAHNPHGLRTRRIGHKVAVELHILVESHLNIQEAHDIATEVEHVIKKRFSQDSFVSVHVEPLEQNHDR